MKPHGTRWKRLRLESCGATTSSGIHPITRPFISYIKLLWDNYGSVNRILHDAFLRAQFMVPHQNIDKACHLTNLTIEMSHSLVEKLTQTSKSFVDPGCYFLFLINNCHFILQQLHTNCTLCFNTLDLAGKIGDYINSYIQVSWAPAQSDTSLLHKILTAAKVPVKISEGLHRSKVLEGSGP